MSFQSTLVRTASLMLATALLAACGGGGGGSSVPPPTAAPTPTPLPSNNATAGGTNSIGTTGRTLAVASAFCNVNQTTQQQSIARQAAMSAVTQPDGGLPRYRATPPARGVTYVPGAIEVTYHTAAMTQRSTMSVQERAVGSQLTSTLTFDRLGLTTHVLSVAPGTEGNAIAALSAQPGVVSVSRPMYRSKTSATTANFPNDNFYDGLIVTGQPAPASPFFQNSGDGGEWDMHLICLSHAWAYAVAADNTLGVANAGAIGTGMTIGVIDTGVDPTHPDLANKVLSTGKVFDKGLGQEVTTESMHDNDGHGTDVAGIAAADTNNGIGFVGAGYNAKILPYKVFPDPPTSGPDAGCPPGTSSPACQSSTADIAAAINDAVAQKVSVINLSLGGPCPDDPAVASAVSNAVANNIVVVAAAGNDGTNSLDCPGGDPGVIPVGASAINDFTNPGTTTESVASYSDYDVTHATTWGVVAPGGDAQNCTSSSCNDNDSLHYIEHIWTTTAAPGTINCSPPSGATTPTVPEPVGDCRLEINGTSQASPHVAGIVALMRGVNPTLTPAQIGQMLCASAVDIGDPKEGCGRVDAYRAVAKAINDPSVP